MAREGKHGKLDRLEWMLLQELQADARQPKHVLAEKLGTSPNTIERRLRRLLDERLIRLIVRVHPSAIGYKGSVAIGVNVSGGKVAGVARDLASLRGIFNVVMNVGRYDVIAWGGYRDSEHLMELIDEGLGMIPGISGAEIITHVKMVKMSSELLAVYDPRVVSELLNVDGKDLRVIEELVKDPRINIRDLAERLGITWSTANRRLERLLDDRIICLSAEPSRRARGYRTGITVLCKVHPRHVRAVAERLGASQFSDTVAICTGPWDVIATMYFHDADEMADFVGTELVSIPDLERHETLLGRHVVRVFGY